MGEIEDAIERADREAFTRELPKAYKGRISYLIVSSKVRRRSRSGSAFRRLRQPLSARRPTRLRRRRLQDRR